MNNILKKGLRSWSKVKTIFVYRKLIRASIKTFKPVLKITNKKIMRYVSMVTIFTMVFGLSFWSTDFNSAHADSTSVGASKDSWIDQKSSKADSNHGDDDDNDLLVRSETGSKNKRLLVAFDLPDLSDYAVIDSATLILHTKNDPPTSRTYGVHRINEDWEELDVTWNNRPDAELSATSTTLTNGVVEDEDMTWDVTSDVQDFYDESLSNYGWMIQDETEDNSPSKESKFRSREYSSDITERPELQIEYHLDLPDGSISGYKFNDLNGDGFWDQEGENPEPGLANWTITLSNGDETTTDNEGYYTFEGLESDDYTVCEVMPDDEDEWSQTYPNGNSDDIADAVIYEFCDEEGDSFGKYGYEVEIDEDQAEEVNFGNVQYGSITIVKETNPLGYADEFTFTVTDQDNTQLSDGQSYTYDGLVAGNYTVQEVIPGGWMLSDVDCIYDGESVGEDTENGEIVSLEAGDDVVCTFTNTKLGSITVWKYADPFGGGFDFELEGPTLGETTIFTGEDGGAYVFENLEPGTYNLSETVPDGWTSDGGSCGEDGNPSNIELSAGGNVSCVFNNTEYGSISGRKFEDLNANHEDDEDPGLEWDINLYRLNDDEWSFITSEPTDSETGNYMFSNLLPGTYKACEVLEGDWIQSYPQSGSDCDGGYGYEVVVSAGQDVLNQDFGNFKKPIVTVYKYNDLDGDGVRDIGEENNEPPLENWTMALGRVGTRQQPEQPAGPDNQIPIEIVAMSLTGIDGSARFTLDQPGDYKAFEAQQDGWSVTSPGQIDSFFDITYDLKSISDGDPDFDLLSIGDPDFDLLRSSFFDIFVEISGQNINSDNQERPLVFLNHLIPSPTPTPSESPEPTPESTPTPTPTPENNGGGGGGGGSPGGIIIDGPGSNNGGGTVAGASTTPTPTPTPPSTPSTGSGQASSGQATPTPNPSGSTSGGGEPSPTPEVTGESPTPTPSETTTPSESPKPEDSNLFAEFLNSLPDSWLWLLSPFVLIARFFIWLSRWS